MDETRVRKVGEQESLEVAEASRQTEWLRPSSMREMFLGRLRVDLLHPFPEESSRRREFEAFFEAFKALLSEQADPAQIDAGGE